LMALLARRGRPLSTLLASLPRTFATPELRRECPDEKKFSVVAGPLKNLRDQGLVFNDIDGIRVEFSDGWGLVRASNTQPALVLRFEAETPERKTEIQETLTRALAQTMEQEGLDPALAHQEASHT
ncbi:MAG: phosphomannomutase, partial [Nitrospiraceae bacterium]|nr:phosphomannomutase [Nitrospiraceae bacterium]